MAAHNVEVNPNGMVVRISIALQRASDLVSFGLHSAHTTEPPPVNSQGTIDLPGVLMQTIWVRATALSGDALRREFARWVLAAGFRDATEAVEMILEEARAIGTIASLAERYGGRTPSEAWNDEVVDGRRKFDRLHWNDKLTQLARLCGPNAVPGLVEELLTIVLARNCLVHRHGFVRADRDVNSSVDGREGLLVKWIGNEFVFVGSGEEQVITEFPFKTSGPGTLIIRYANRTRFFAVGEPVEFTSREFGEICFMLYRFVQQFAANLHALLIAKGVPESGRAASIDERAEVVESAEP